MPAKSKAQQALMAMCSHSPSHAKGTCPTGLTKEQMREYARTPTKNLPERKRPPKR